MHLDLVKVLKSILLGYKHKITLLGDGEFDNCELLDFCEKNQWEYVFRTSKSTLIQTAEGDEFSLRDLNNIDKRQDYFILTHVKFTKKEYGPVSCGYWHQNKFDDPIFLVSNIEYGPDIIRKYRKRFSIETMFKDLKSAGFNIHKTKMSNSEKLSKLLIVVCISYLLSITYSSFKKTLKKLSGSFLRKDRWDDYSIFHKGMKALNKLKRILRKIKKKFYKNPFHKICVRW